MVNLTIRGSDPVCATPTVELSLESVAGGNVTLRAHGTWKKEHGNPLESASLAILSVGTDGQLHLHCGGADLNGLHDRDNTGYVTTTKE